jgi:hypothetical protein
VTEDTPDLDRVREAMREHDERQEDDPAREGDDPPRERDDEADADDA